MTVPLSRATIVLTGASSGIGRATALAFAGRGATLVLAARRGRELEEVARSCEELGARAIPFPTDVRDPEEVEALARGAVERAGGFDVWVNNAAVMAVGSLHEVPVEVSRSVVETNLLGTLFGARAALAHFRNRGRGILVNVSSVLGATAAKLVSSYSASKFGVQGLSEALRQEVMDDPGIHVCDVQPATVDTPLFRHVANYTGRAVKPVWPVFPPEQVARAIVSLAERPRRTVTVGWSGYVLRWGHALAPALVERVLSRMAGVAFEDRPVPPTSGNTLAPPTPGLARTAGDAAAGPERP